MEGIPYKFKFVKLITSIISDKKIILMYLKNIDIFEIESSFQKKLCNGLLVIDKRGNQHIFAI